MISFLYSSSYLDEETGCPDVDMKMQGDKQGSAEKLKGSVAMSGTTHPGAGCAMTLQPSTRLAAPTVQCAGLRYLRVYGVADKFGIAALQAVARQKLLVWIESHGSTDDCVMVVREIFDNMTGNYDDLRGEVSRVVKRNVDSLIGSKAFCQLLQDHNDYGVELFRYVMARDRFFKTVFLMHLSGKQVYGGDPGAVLETLTHRFDICLALRGIDRQDRCEYCRMPFDVRGQVSRSEMRRAHCRRCLTVQ